MARKNIFTDTSGAITVDWLVLTAAIVGLGVVVLSSISASVFHPQEVLQNEQHF